jgi:ribosomal protein S18 acetylase RimI-like enzyme
MHITLRPATAGDLPCVRRLYLDTMREVTERVLAWDQTKQAASFDARFVPAEVWIVLLDGTDIGWMQVAERDGEFVLKQFFIDPRFQRRGIGTRLLRDLIERAERAGKAITLGVVKGNPARSLYERHGFHITGEDWHKVYMARKS